MEGVEGPFLIVAPLSTLPHWEREVASWTDMYSVVFHGSEDSRRVILAFDWRNAERREGRDGRRESPPSASSQGALRSANLTL